MKRDAWGTVVLLVIVAICIYIWYRTSDFALALSLITLAFFVIWIGDWLLFARRRKARAAAEDSRPHEPVLVDYARSFFPVILAVLLFRTFLLEPFRIPSGSMMPTLLVGDFVLVNKFAYGLRLPVSNSRILAGIDSGEPQRGDIAVFRYPGFTCHRADGEVVRGGDPSCSSPVPKEDYIKRIIGLPGDTVTLRGEQVSIDGKPMPQTLIGPYQGTDKVSIEMEENPMMAPVTLHEEDLGRVKHRILQFRSIEPYRCTGSGGTLLPDGGCRWVVPQGQYFAMGDNRDDSEDSRYWGFVPEQNLAGKAFFIWFSLAGWHRIGTVL
ncbi:MAG: signal peptidase I [Rhodanobacteraceae bacterium]